MLALRRQGPCTNSSYRFLYLTDVLFFSCILTEGFTVLAFTEDVDPSVGRFRNMVQTAVVPVKVQSNSQLSNEYITLMNSLYELHLRNIMFYGGKCFIVKQKSCSCFTIVFLSD